MRTQQDLALLRQRAAALRLEGKSRRAIQAILGPMSNSTLNDILRGTTPPDWTRRPNAKDDLRAQARELRRQGHDYTEIAACLSVSKSSVSLWVRDLPRPPRLSYEESRRRSSEGARRYWADERQVRAAQRAGEIAAAASEIGELTERELIIAGAIAYWCEGAKQKPRHGYERIIFVNSDARLIRLFLRFLAAAGVPRDDLSFRVAIHESGDVETAHRFWQEVTGATPDQFKRVSLKRHNPKTNRKNVGEGYYARLCVSVYRSRALYRKIEGWVSSATTSSALSAI